MALVSCNGCGNEMNARAEACPRCGTKVVHRPLGARALMLIGAVVVLVIIAFWYY